MSTASPLTNEEADLLLSLSDSELEQWLSTLPASQQTAVLSQLANHQTETERIIDDPAEFRKKLLIDCDGQPRPMASVIEPWQASDFAEVDRGWRRAVHGTGNGKLLAYLERSKGHSKTTDTAAMASWALYAAQRKIKGVAGAADKDQAKLLRDAIDTMYRLNPWLAEVLEVQRYTVKNRRTGSELEIVSADEASSHGELPDFVIVDELTHHKKNGLWESLFAGSAKRAACMLVVMANAGLGMGTSWQWKAREMFRENPHCYFSRLDGPQASWITPERLAIQRSGLSPKAFNRLWLNQWQTDDGDALDAADIEACCILPGPIEAPEPGWEYVGCLDLGHKHDHAALVVLGCSQTQRKVRLASVQSWKPAGPRHEVDLLSVARDVRRAQERFGLWAIYYDYWQAAMMAQMLPVQMIQVNLSAPKVCTEIANTLICAFREGSIELYRDEALLRDFTKISIIERVWGFKLEAIRDEEGHADRAIALALGLPRALDFAAELAAGMHQEHDEPETVWT